MPVVLLTASEAATIRRRAYDVGCTGFLVEPTEVEDLLAVIEEVLDACGRAQLRG